MFLIQTVFRIYRLKIAEREQVANTQSTIKREGERKGEKKQRNEEKMEKGRDEV